MVYLPEELVGDIGVAYARIVVHDEFLDQIGSKLRLFSRNVNFRRWRIIEKILMNDYKAASVDSETSESESHSKCYI